MPSCGGFAEKRLPNEWRTPLGPCYLRPVRQECNGYGGCTRLDNWVCKSNCPDIHVLDSFPWAIQGHLCERVSIDCNTNSLEFGAILKHFEQANLGDIRFCDPTVHFVDTEDSEVRPCRRQGCYIVCKMYTAIHVNYQGVNAPKLGERHEVTAMNAGVRWSVKLITSRWHQRRLNHNGHLYPTQTLQWDILRLDAHMMLGEKGKKTLSCRRELDQHPRDCESMWDVSPVSAWTRLRKVA
jgi:hypothetical protein